MKIAFNPFTGSFDFVGGASSSSNLGPRWEYIQAVLASYDQTLSLTFADELNEYRRIVSITYFSTLYPDMNVSKNISYLDVGTMNQRIDEIEFVGDVFLPNTLKKVYEYDLMDFRYVQSGFYFELGV